MLELAKARGRTLDKKKCSQRSIMLDRLPGSKGKKKETERDSGRNSEIRKSD